MKKLKFLMVILVSVTIQSFGGVCISGNSGDWGNSSTWACGHVPVCGDAITISAGNVITITVQQDYFSACFEPMYITVNGELVMQTGKKLMLPVGSYVETNVGGVITPSGGGGGSSNLIDIGGINWWKAGDGVVNGYELFGVKTGLPIKLLSFEANSVGDKIEILWATASETNNDHFTIEKTKDGVQFESISTVEGAGNSTCMKRYKGIDNYPYEGHSYYRLNQTDFNGTSTQSDLVAVDYIKNASFSLNIYPNPSNGVCMNLDMYAKKGEETFFVLTDSFGNPIYSEVIVINENETKTYSFCLAQKLNPGVYFVRVKTEHKEYVKKIIID